MIAHVLMSGKKLDECMHEKGQRGGGVDWVKRGGGCRETEGHARNRILRALSEHACAERERV